MHAACECVCVYLVHDIATSIKIIFCFCFFAGHRHAGGRLLNYGIGIYRQYMCMLHVSVCVCIWYVCVFLHVLMCVFGCVCVCVCVLILSKYNIKTPNQNYIPAIVDRDFYY